ncbi:MAG: hypothetical protein LBN39_04280 [Planctomycetaceae bacterium]|jgi:hypothetical protein|nr:hypothetical protein [Planctomycetaceae bacterium]
MDPINSQLIIEYEITEPFTDNTFIVKSLAAAKEYYDRGYTVYERHISSFKPTKFSATRTAVTLLWHDPDITD